jgi:hypothetical protein
MSSLALPEGGTDDTRQAQVDVLPPYPEDLPAPHPGHDGQSPDRLETIAVNSLEEPSELGGLPDRDAVAHHARRLRCLRPRRRVVVDEAGIDRVGECLVDEPVQVADGAETQRASKHAAPDQLGVERIELTWL